MDEIPIHVILERLVAHWKTRIQGFDVYFRSIFNVAEPKPLPRRLRLGQISDGSIRPENIGHELAALWLVDADGILSVPLNFEWRTQWDTDESDTYFLTSTYFFVSEGNELLLSERYGPGFFHRLYGQIVNAPEYSIEWKSLWHYGSDKK